MKTAFGYPDLLRSVQYTLDWRKLVLQAIGLLVALPAFFLFSTIAYYVQGSLKFLPWFLNLLGVIAFYLILLVFSAPTTYLTLEEIKTGRRRSVAGALRAGLGFAKDLALAPLGVISFLLSCGILLALLICLGMFPSVGPLLWAILIIPQFILSLFLVVGVLTLIAGTLLLPSIIVGGRVSAAEAFRELSRLVRKNVLRFWGYVFTALFLNAAYFILTSILIIASLYVFFGLSSLLLGDKPGMVILSLPPFFHKIAPFLEKIIPLPSSLPEVNWIFSSSGLAGGISLLIIYVIWLSYPFLYAFTSGVIIYLSLREKGE